MADTVTSTVLVVTVITVPVASTVVNVDGLLQVPVVIERTFVLVRVRTVDVLVPVTDGIVDVEVTVVPVVVV
jgi:hypothetical protein